MGALKQRFQCLYELRIKIHNVDDHITALRWITVAIILHNLVIDVDGPSAHNMVLPPGDLGREINRAEEEEEEEEENINLNADGEAGEAKRQRLIAELMTFRRDVLGIN